MQHIALQIASTVVVKQETSMINNPLQTIFMNKSCMIKDFNPLFIHPVKYSQQTTVVDKEYVQAIGLKKDP